MESITMYNDLPPINVIPGDPLGLLEGQGPVSIQHQRPEYLGGLDTLPKWSSIGNQQTSDVYDSVLKKCSKVSSWLPLATKLELTNSCYKSIFENPEAPVCRLRPTSLARTHGLREESLGSDQTSSGGSWSPEDSEDCSRYETIGVEPLARSENGVESPTSWPCGSSHRIFASSPATLTGDGKNYDSGVTLQDVQHFPDHCATDSANEPMSMTDTEDHEILAQRFSGIANTMHAVLPGTDQRHGLDGTPCVGHSGEPNEDPTFGGTESIDDSEFQDPSRKAVGRCTTKRTRSARTTNGREALKTSKKRVSKHSTRKSPKQTKYTTSMKDRFLASRCHDCEFETTSNSTLRKHALTVHIRPFTCSFRIYGCSATFGSKNEWKRHVSSQHLRLGFWRCDLDGCLPSRATFPKSSNTANDFIRVCSEEDVAYNDFNRKDLFTQHLRRMHAPGRGASKADREAFNCSLNEICTRCWISTRSPPGFRTCGFCDQGDPPNGDDFGKVLTWEARMEHVGRHLELGHGKSRAWREDSVLRDWMIENGLIEQSRKGEWTLSSLQQGKGKVAKTVS